MTYCKSKGLYFQVLFSFSGTVKTTLYFCLKDLIHNYGKLKYQCQSNKINTFLTEFNNMVLYLILFIK